MRTPATGHRTARARALITLALSALLAVAFGLSSLSPTAGAPIAAGPQAPGVADGLSSCPQGNSFIVPRPASGWANYSTDPSPDTFTDGTFSVDLIEWWGTPAYPDDTSLMIWNAFPAILSFHVTNSVGTLSYPDKGSFPERTTSYYGAILGPTQTETPPPTPDPNPPAIDRIEFCYEDPPDPLACGDGLAYYAFEPTDGFPISDYWAEEPDYVTYTDGAFSVEMGFTSPDGVVFFFRNASADVWSFAVWFESGYPDYYPESPDYGWQPPARSSEHGEGETTSDGIWINGNPTRIEFCAEAPELPPPGPSTCPALSERFTASMPAGGWYEGKYSATGFSVSLEFDAPAVAFTQGGVVPLIVSFSDASRPVQKVFVADQSNLAPEEYVYTIPVTEDEFLSGPEGDDITRIEFCYVPLPPPPTPTLPLPTPTLPLPTPTQPVPTPTLPLPTPTLPLPTPTLPLPTPTLPLPTPTQPQPQPNAPTPTPTLAPTPTPTASPTTSPTSSAPLTPSPVITAAPTDAPTASPTATPTATPTLAPTPSEPTETPPVPPILRWANTIPPANAVTTDLAAIGFSTLLVLLFILLALFPASLFNETIEEHYDVIAGWFAFGGTAGARFRGALSRFWNGRGGVVFFLLLTGVIYGFLDPRFGLDGESIALFLGIVIGLGITTVAFEYPLVVAQKRVNMERGVVRVLPLTIFIALACVVVSRVAEFQPGYLYGLIAFWAFDRALPRRAAGLSVALTCALILLMSLVAWALLPGVDAALAGSPLLQVFATTVLAVIFIGGLEGLLVELVPIRFLRGQHVWAWKRSVWLILFLVAGFAFVHILLNPSADYLLEARGEAVGVAVAFFIGFGVLSVVTWGFFRYVYKPRPA